MSSNISDVGKNLKSWLSKAKKVAVVGVGNSIRKDDFVGVQVVRDLRGKLSDSVLLIECETVPENFIEPINEFKPSHVLIVDAALLNLEPGSVKLIDTAEITGIPTSTHTLPLNIFSEFVKMTTGAEVALLAIQPKDTSLGEGLTKKLKITIKDLTDILSQILNL